MKILVTGTAGFIGMHLARRLAAEGHAVTGLDNFNDYYTVVLKEARAERLEKEGVCRTVRLDLCDKEGLDRLFADGTFDCVCNLAAQAGVRYSLTNPDAYLRSNLEGFLNILECCRRHGVPRLLYASSSSVYGGNTKYPFSEDDKVDTPVSLYAATKKSNELMAHTYSHLFGFQTIGLRFFTVYGPWGRPDMAPWLFTEAMLGGRPIKVFNRGDMYRDFTFIDDIVAGVVACVRADSLPKCAVYNIGNNRCEKLTDFIQAFADALGVEPELDLQPMQPGDVYKTAADITRLHDAVGYSPTTPISVGVPKFVDWYKNTWLPLKSSLA